MFISYFLKRVPNRLWRPFRELCKSEGKSIRGKIVQMIADSVGEPVKKR